MQQSRRGNAYTTTLMGLILCALLTIVFAGIAWMKHDEAEMHRLGGEQDPNGLNQMLDNRADMEEEIAGYQAQIEAMQYELSSISLKLAGRSAVFDDESQRWVIGGDDWKTRRQLMSEEVAFTLQILEGRVQARQNPDPIFQPLEELITSLRDQTHEVLRDIADMDHQLDQDKERLNQKLDALEEKSAKDKKDFERKYSEVATEVSQADDQIRRLLELELRWLHEIKPDGLLVGVTEDRRTVYANLGSVDRVQRGMVFDIFQYVKGRFVLKGLCEVADVREHISKCRVLSEEDPVHQPLAKEDMIGNPIFSTSRPLNFVLAGEFHQYNRADLEDFIRRTGGKVWDDLAPGVDFLVAGARSDAEQDKAREYQIIAMTEDQLVRYLDTTFQFAQRAE